MNFSKNTFNGANNVSKANNFKNTNTFGRTSISDIKQSMLNTNINSNKQTRELIEKKEAELKRKHEAFADQQRMYNPTKAVGRSNVQAQNELRRGFNRGN